MSRCCLHPTHIMKTSFLCWHSEWLSHPKEGYIRATCLDVSMDIRWDSQQQCVIEGRVLIPVLSQLNQPVEYSGTHCTRLLLHCFYSEHFISLWVRMDLWLGTLSPSAVHLMNFRRRHGLTRQTHVIQFDCKILNHTFLSNETSQYFGIFLGRHV